MNPSIPVWVMGVLQTAGHPTVGAIISFSFPVLNILLKAESLYSVLDAFL